MLKREDGSIWVCWDGMTDEGCAALVEVILGGRLTVVYVRSEPLYELTQKHPPEANWTPMALAPAAAANIQRGRMLLNVPDEVIDLFMAKAAAMGVGHEWRRLDCPGSWVAAAPTGFHIQ
jgi:hypothetical protein